MYAKNYDNLADFESSFKSVFQEASIDMVLSGVLSFKRRPDLVFDKSGAHIENKYVLSKQLDLIKNA